MQLSVKQFGKCGMGNFSEKEKQVWSVKDLGDNSAGASSQSQLSCIDLQPLRHNFQETLNRECTCRLLISW